MDPQTVHDALLKAVNIFAPAMALTSLEIKTYRYKGPLVLTQACTVRKMVKTIWIKTL
ncbi:MAG: hypothetical protein R2784_03440 [Saprospiraceae bacterium]